MGMVNGPPREDWGELRFGWGAQGSSGEGVAAPMGGRAAGHRAHPAATSAVLVALQQGTARNM